MRNLGESISLKDLLFMFLWNLRDKILPSYCQP